MGLRILVIGRGDAQKTQVGSSHKLEFFSNAYDPCSDFDKKTGKPTRYIEIDKYDFVVMHLSIINPEGPSAIDFWKSKGHTNTLIGLSGGKVTDLKGEFSSTGIPCIENCTGYDGIVGLPWDRVPANFEGDAKELHWLLTATLPDRLCALTILCRGYLTVFANQIGLKEVPDYLKSWKLENCLSYSNYIEQVVSHDFWAAFEEENPSDLYTKAQADWEELGSGGNFCPVGILINCITSGNSIRDGKIVSMACLELEAKLGASRGS